MKPQTQEIFQPYNGTIRFEANWFAAGVIVDNATNQWFVINGQGKYIPPQQIGMVISLAPSARTVTIAPSAPPPGGRANGAAGGTITATFLSELPTDDGGIDYSLVAAIDSLNTLIGTLNANVVILNTSIQDLYNGQGAIARAAIATDYTSGVLDSAGSGATLNNFIPAAPAGKRIYLTGIWGTCHVNIIRNDIASLAANHYPASLSMLIGKMAGGTIWTGNIENGRIYERISPGSTFGDVAASLFIQIESDEAVMGLSVLYDFWVEYYYA